MGVGSGPAVNSREWNHVRMLKVLRMGLNTYNIHSYLSEHVLNDVTITSNRYLSNVKVDNNRVAYI